MVSFMVSSMVSFMIFFRNFKSTGRMEMVLRGIGRKCPVGNQWRREVSVTSGLRPHVLHTIVYI